jgi:hypothetical protein
VQNTGIEILVIHRVNFLIHKIGFQEHASGKLTPNEIDITARLQTGTLK